jgi:hypothetical protein
MQPHLGMVFRGYTPLQYLGFCGLSHWFLRFGKIFKKNSKEVARGGVRTRVLSISFIFSFSPFYRWATAAPPRWAKIFAFLAKKINFREIDPRSQSYDYRRYIHTYLQLHTTLALKLACTFTHCKKISLKRTSLCTCCAVRFCTAGVLCNSWSL